jgi:SNF family Na+-dependent transporter
MGAQDIAVALIVCGAVAFLLRRVIGRRRRKATAQSFVPLSSLKKRSATASQDDSPPCH